MPLTLSSPIVPATITTYTVIKILLDVDPSEGIALMYKQVDSNGAQVGEVITLTLSAANVTVFKTTAGGLKAKAYAALEAQLGVSGTVS